MSEERAAVLARLRADPSLAGLRRSLDYYYGDAVRERRADELYARFVRPGDLVFDVGAHVGDRVAGFRRLGARVVALEPQPACARVLRELYAGDEAVTVVEAACGAASGTVELHVNAANPTVSTASGAFVSAADGARGWEGQVWGERIDVPLTTLDALIERFGRPAFVKIDVEGYEDAVLAGLSEPVPALSFEFTTIAREVAGRCLRRVAELGYDGFDAALGDSMELTFGRPVTHAEIAAHLAGLPHEANAGDVYAMHPTAGRPALP